MVSQSPARRNESSVDQPSALRPALAPEHNPLEDSQIMTMFDGVCGTRSVEVTRAGRDANDAGAESDASSRPVIRQREIGHVAEPMC